MIMELLIWIVMLFIVGILSVAVIMNSITARVSKERENNDLTSKITSLEKEIEELKRNKNQ
jgi:cell division protein FtsB